MPVKELIADELVADGCMCTLGVVGAARGVDMQAIDAHNYRKVAETFGIARAMAQEVMFINDEGGWRYDEETPAQRWERMRSWVDEQLRPEMGEVRHG